MGWKTQFSEICLRSAGGGADDPPRSGEGGVTLLEMLVAMLILAMVSAMLYSLLNVGIAFSRKGEVRARQTGQERAFLELLHRQVQGAWFDRKQKKVLIENTGSKQLSLVTNAPLLNRDLGVVMAVYLYDPDDDILYYTEKKDFYNADYREDYQVNRREMLVLMREVGGALSMEYQDEEGLLKVLFRDREHALAVRCWQPGVG